MAKIFFALTLAFGVLVGSMDARAAGAIAVDDADATKASEVGFGVGTGATREEAGIDAVRECKKAGNSSCKVAVRYDTCGAYATSKDYTGVGWGSTEGEAKANALEACGKGCRVAVSDCQ
ncbi:hypothetical protein CCC_04059 [Paramagnetospirillum magnetotacticum MS-1]|uniref:DUF4189 domain-containing protein n=1 Tax=Paramagnetospirillum magnetotacticum MS-1 TaxID=272627 RepID=A0A0C2YWP0_PARME|nr:DUF4189 domain-containing protein [Paramagnetospirillum magnetotacticum]KIL99543.1 hypothetical protein CCC_04059 [Paramagnetospirillum magnetotacticum MS-1]